MANHAALADLFQAIMTNGGPRSSSSRICTCTCITNYFFSLTDTTASAILLQQAIMTNNNHNTLTAHSGSNHRCTLATCI